MSSSPGETVSTDTEGEAFWRESALLFLNAIAIWRKRESASQSTIVANHALVNGMSSEESLHLKISYNHSIILFMLSTQSCMLFLGHGTITKMESLCMCS